MFKFAKYFFIVFLMTTIIPLVLMFTLHNAQMDKMHSKMSQNAINLAKTKVEYALSDNLKVQEGEILKRLYFMSGTNYDIKAVQGKLKDYKTEIIPAAVQKPHSYYEKQSDLLYATTLLPYKKNHGLKIKQKVNIELLRPTGPYNIELRFDKNNKNVEAKNLVVDPLSKKTIPRIAMIFFNKPIHEIVPIKGENQDVGYIFLILNVTPFMAKLNELITGLFILLVGVVSSFIIGLIVDRVFVHPLMGLSKAAKEIKKGNFSFRLKSDVQEKTIKNLYNNFNDMAQNLEAKENLRQSFISNLTHDLRTPLVSQSQSLEFISIKFKELGLQNEFELAESLAKNNEHLLKMVNLILESYCFDPSKLKLKMEDLSLYDVVDGCEEKLRPLSNEKKIEFINNVDENCPSIKADFMNLTRVFMNLLSNAIENTPENRYIKVSAHFDEKFAYAEIEDNGNGIAPEDLKFIFERYYSGKSLERKLGSGFGLSVCEKLVEMHGGKIQVESEVNKYTKFTIKLPRGGADKETK